MAVNPISERQIMVLTTDGRLSLIELEGAARNKEDRTHNISRPIMCLEDMIPGKNSLSIQNRSKLISLTSFFPVPICTCHFQIQVH